MMVVDQLVLQNQKKGQEEGCSTACCARAEDQHGLQGEGRVLYEDPCVVYLKRNGSLDQ